MIGIGRRLELAIRKISIIVGLGCRINNGFKLVVLRFVGITYNLFIQHSAHVGYIHSFIGIVCLKGFNKGPIRVGGVVIDGEILHAVGV